MLCSLKVPCPPPGIYPDVEFHEYASWDALSNSDLSQLKRSPRHYRFGLVAESTDALKLGELFHTGILEPTKFAERYVMQPAFHNDPLNATASGEPSTSRGTKYVKQREAAFAELHCGRIIIEPELYEKNLLLVEQLAANEHANRILNADGPREVSLVWHEEIEASGGEIETVSVKCRIDKVARSLGILADCKSTAKLERFPYSIGQFSYHRQLSHYRTGWEKLTGERLEPWLIACESCAPFTVLAAPLGVDELYEGHEERDELLRLYVQCRATDHWPGMASPSVWTMPSFFFSSVTLHGGNNQTLEV